MKWKSVYSETLQKKTTTTKNPPICAVDYISAWDKEESDFVDLKVHNVQHCCMEVGHGSYANVAAAGNNSPAPLLFSD